MKKRVLIGICATAAVLAVSFLIVTMPRGEIQKHLSKNHASLFTDAKAMDLIDTDKFDLFISGESHAIEKNFRQQLFLIKYLHENANVNYILAEDGVGSAGLMNMYLQTGDEQILKDIFAELRGTMANTSFTKICMNTIKPCQRAKN